MTSLLTRLGFPFLIAASVYFFSPVSTQAQAYSPTIQSASWTQAASPTSPITLQAASESSKQDKDDGDPRRHTPSLSFGLSMALLGLSFLILYFFSTRRRAHPKRS